MKRWFYQKWMEQSLKFKKYPFKVPDIGMNQIKKFSMPLVFCTQNIDYNPLMFEEKQIGSFEKKTGELFFSKIQIVENTPDIRSLWEAGRLQIEARSILLCPDEDILLLDGLKNKILAWIDHNPFLYGIHYLSPMECGLRIPVFFYLVKKVENRLTSGESQKILYTIYTHAWWIFRNLALYSSLGNHTVCECVGLVFGGAFFEETKEGRQWLERGCELLEQELPHQILDDGGPAEQSFNYHRFVLDLYWLVVDFLEQNKLYDCSTWKDRLKDGELFLKKVGFDKLSFPSFGDSDDGYAIAPGLTPLKQMDHDEENEQVNCYSCITFEASGYTVIREDSGLFMVFDHGPLGMGPLYNHGHADALSIVLYKNGLPFLVDPGTYRYNGVPEYREYFKGTRAHNTVYIDNRDQAEQVTGFIWKNPYKSKLISTDNKSKSVSLVAEHNGYQRLNKPVVHQRKLVVNKDVCCIIVDSFRGEGIHNYELNYHLDPGVSIEIEDKWLMLNNGNESLFLYNPKDMFSIFKGREEPMIGWYSPAYGVIEKTHTLQAKATGVPNEIVIATIICLSNDKKEESILKSKELMVNACNDIQF